MLCSVCNAKLPKDALFCPKCGSRVIDIVVRNLAEEGPASNEEVNEPEEVIMPAEFECLDPAEEQSEDPSSKKSRPSVNADSDKKSSDRPFSARGKKVFTPDPSNKNEGNKKKKSNNKFLIGVVALVVIAVIAACGFFVNRTANTTHSVLMTVNAKGYEAEDSTGIPVQIVGTDIHNNAVEEIQFVDSDGQGITLVEGEYELTILASPLQKSGVIFDFPTETMNMTINNSKEIAVGGEIDLTPTEATEITDDQVENALNYAKQDPEANLDVLDDWADATIKARETAIEKKEKEEAEAAAKEKATKEYIKKITEQAKTALDLQYNDYEWYEDPCEEADILSSRETWQADYTDFYGKDYFADDEFHEDVYQLQSIESLEASEDGTVKFTVKATPGSFMVLTSSSQWHWESDEASTSDATKTLTGTIKFDSKGAFVSASFIEE